MRPPWPLIRSEEPTLASVPPLVRSSPPPAQVRRSLRELARCTSLLTQVLRLRHELVRCTPPLAKVLRSPQGLVRCSPPLPQVLRSLQELNQRKGWCDGLHHWRKCCCHYASKTVGAVAMNSTFGAGAVVPAGSGAVCFSTSVGAAITAGASARHSTNNATVEQKQLQHRPQELDFSSPRARTAPVRAFGASPTTSVCVRYQTTEAPVARQDGNLRYRFAVISENIIPTTQCESSRLPLGRNFIFT